MIANINTSVSVCGASMHIYSISTDRSKPNSQKKYYQHRHPGFEIHYILDGEYNVTCSGKTHILRQDSMLLVPPGAYHNLTPCTPNTTRLCLIFNIEKHSQLTASTPPFYEVFDRSNPTLIHLQDCEPQRILHRIASVVDDRTDKIYKSEKLLHLCSVMLLELIPFIATESHELLSEPKEKHEDINYKIDNFLGTNFMHNGAKSRIAADLYISPRQLQRVIQKNYGMNYRQKLSETRVQIANDLLCNTNMPIHQIAEILGYSCSANFSAFVKRLTGKTPSQIRKSR